MPALLAMRSPTRVEPVKETMSTLGEAASVSPISAPRPVTTLSVPAGRPASSIAFAK